MKLWLEGVERRWNEGERKFLQWGGKRKKGEIEEGAPQEQGVKMLIWNVKRLSSLEKEDKGFIKNHEIIGLTETWARIKDEGKVKDWLEEHEEIMVLARKSKGGGNPKGGMILVCRKGKIEVGERKENEETIVAKVKMKE